MAEPRYDVTSLGEMLLRLSVPAGMRLEGATKLELHAAGAEANVISLLARLERNTCWFGALPDNPLGGIGANALRIAGVDTRGIIWAKQGRMGAYYVEFGIPPRGTQVIYDRAHSGASEMQVHDVNWNALLDTRLIHLTGITPALSPSCRDVIDEAISQAKQRGIPISFDVNYRSKLWSENEAQEKLTPLIQSVEILFCSLHDATRLFKCSGTAKEIAYQMLERSQAKYMVMTSGENGALLWNGSEWLHEPSRATQIIDRLGAGDALAAGVIHGWLDGNIAQGLRYGSTLAALALTQHGDMVITNKAELNELSKSDSALMR